MSNMFAGWSCAKRAELLAAAYMMAGGVLFLTHPERVLLPMQLVTDTLLSQAHWGWIMSLVALTHAFALWANGRWPMSVWLRIGASIIHLSVSLTFSLLFFGSGLPFRGLTFLVVSAVILVGGLAPMEQVARRCAAWKILRRP